MGQKLLSSNNSRKGNLNLALGKLPSSNSMASTFTSKNLLKVTSDIKSAREKNCFKSTDFDNILKSPKFLLKPLNYFDSFSVTSKGKHKIIK